MTPFWSKCFCIWRKLSDRDRVWKAITTVECRAHKSWQYKEADRSSRMQADLLSSPHNASGATNFSEDTMIRRLLPAGRVPHVCVVGAGMAGLRCADVLTKKGVKVTLLEARNRIGGRVGISDPKKVLGS